MSNRNSILFAANDTVEIRLPDFEPHVNARRDLKIYVRPETFTAEDFAEAVEEEAELQARKYGRLKTLDELQASVEWQYASDMVDNACYYMTGSSLSATDLPEDIAKILINLCNRTGVIPMFEEPYFRMYLYQQAALWLAETLQKVRSSLSSVWEDLTEDAQERVYSKTCAAFIAAVKNGNIPAQVKINDCLTAAFSC